MRKQSVSEEVIAGLNLAHAKEFSPEAVMALIKRMDVLLSEE